MKGTTGAEMRALFVMLLAGCVVTETNIDTNPICVGDPSWITEVEIVEDAPFTAGFSSATCGKVTEAWCELELEGDTIYVSTFQEREHPMFSETCLAIERGIDITCDTEPLAAGTYSLVHGNGEEVIEVPSTVEPFCVSPE